MKSCSVPWCIAQTSGEGSMVPCKLHGVNPRLHPEVVKPQRPRKFIPTPWDDDINDRRASEGRCS